jgi:hypothetical protein
MTHPVIQSQRPRCGTTIATAVLFALAATGIAAADDRDRDGGDRYYYHDAYGDGYRDSGYYRAGHDRHDHHQHDRHHRHHEQYDHYQRGYYGDARGYYYGGPAHGGPAYGYGYYRPAYPRAPFVVPRHLHHGDYQVYDPYYRGTVYYAPHHHQHRVYLFPVIVDGYTEYRPFAYCAGAYFPGQYGYPTGPRGYLGFQFGF